MNKYGRPRKYNTDAERQKAYRERERDRQAQREQDAADAACARVMRAYDRCSYFYRDDDTGRFMCNQSKEPCAYVHEGTCSAVIE